MKKFGFTLAEILIALGIVGVVAAITLPTFTASTQNQANASKLSATVSTLENAFSAIIAGEGYDDFDEIYLYKNYGNPDILSRYLKGGSGGANNGATKIYGSSSPFKTISGSSYNTTFDQYSYYELKSGAVIFTELFRNDYLTSCSAYIDVNGAAAPNKLGRDVFGFYLKNNGVLIPFGLSDFDNWKTSDSVDSKCKNGDLGTGRGCTGRLVENNYKVDY